LSVWDVETKQLVGPAVTLTGPVHQAWFSNDGSRLLTVTTAAGGAGSEVRVWDTTTGTSVLGPLTFPRRNGGGFEIYRCAISPDGNRIVLTGPDNLCKEYEVDSGKEVTPSPPHLGGIIWSGEFSADSRRILSAGSEATARLWDAETGRAIGSPLRHPTFVRDATLAPDGRRVATIDAEKKVRLWDAETGDLLVPPFTLPLASIGRLWFSADGRRVIALDTNGTTKQWTLPTFELPQPHVAPFMKLLTSRYLDERDGLDDVAETEFREHNELYREAWLAWRRTCGKIESDK
jgi:WD40 repeat protein